VHWTSAGFALTFGDSAPNGGFGALSFFPPIPALASNTAWCVLINHRLLTGESPGSGRQGVAPAS
jgi:hypothetical protein